MSSFPTLHSENRPYLLSRFVLIECILRAQYFISDLILFLAYTDERDRPTGVFDGTQAIGRYVRPCIINLYK